MFSSNQQQETSLGVLLVTPLLVAFVVLSACPCSVCSVQYLGTGKISFMFAPIVLVWLIFNASLGFYNLSTCGWGILQVRKPFKLRCMLPPNSTSLRGRYMSCHGWSTCHYIEHS
jgi:KUP system potassium uptake protein